MNEAQGLPPLTDEQKLDWTQEQIDRYRAIDAEIKRRQIDGEPNQRPAGDAGIQAQMIHEAMTDESLTVAERCSVAQAYARWPVRCMSDSPGPNGERVIDDPTHLADDIAEAKRQRGWLGMLMGEAVRLTRAGARDES